MTTKDNGKKKPTLKEKLLQKAAAIHAQRVGSVIETLMTLGLPDPRPSFARTADNPVSVKATIPIMSSHEHLHMDFENVQPDNILLEMFDLCYRHGFQQGLKQTEEKHALGLFETFPHLSKIVRDIAEETAGERIRKLEDVVQELWIAKR